MKGYLRNSQFYSSEPLNCPPEWLEVDYQRISGGNVNERNYIRTCYINEKCFIMYLKGFKPGNNDYEPSECPTAWYQADYSKTALDSLSYEYIRTCYKCDTSPSTSSIKITTKPSESKIYLNRQDKGETEYVGQQARGSLILDNIFVGNNNVRIIARDGYYAGPGKWNDIRFDVEVEGGQQTEILIDFSRNFVSVNGDFLSREDFISNR